MKNNALWVFVILVLVVGGWYFWSVKGKEKKIVSPVMETATPTATPTVIPVTVETKTVVLNQIGTSGQKGTAVFQVEGDKTKVTLTMTGKKYTSPQPAHIHIGACPKPGEVKYPLSSVVDGKSETLVSVKMGDLFKDLPLAVNVHESAEKAAVYTACGDLK
ncbi:TPA: hypothetical protein DCP77_01520 [Candidatus Collierbacteria bacterium]|uniref:CHRD domain-containing protein n=1 Tax=Candidatus Collierbacteria bacterium GW2011_GWA2_42_17 TaxID=1618378 RepID=A0A0G0Z1F3_9BACT|nr:MAG: hypothetical protein UU94_C0009G0009 [Candidatus Collierbacteria bacterium GW2011_GWB2_42_12]KKS42610.1 MAG: hypothetical protein UV06_C0009G0030 [Candidatus Collierbacteria bacterium GW2011_GWA2_42_17]KKS62048.1 MAG: hypothetical protein UV30_C0025G0011 [Candidatus Collierbacteria bacterium GW2011_GWF1_42_50]KKS62607.1 MAG: hypothetical protein UV29_C0013G0011 [Candidatus Collierbacteria bacterium GW2011_GWD2_42_50]KKS62638.1 MAG: hypothetical protein UV28_C0007G0008 [Candidatus Collie